MLPKLIAMIKSFKEYRELFITQDVKLIKSFNKKTGAKIKFLDSETIRKIVDKDYTTTKMKVVFSINDKPYILYYDDYEYGDTVNELCIFEAKKEVKIAYVPK